MRYRLGMKDDGWLVVDTERRRVAHFGGLKLEGLSPEEAHVMLGLAEAYDRGLASEDDTGSGAISGRSAGGAGVPQMN
ncbi:hypothetical protein [Enterovirga aerilata]|uniref:Uncharacterized protein n=1 Tax=Enterovirga aerilata TaxID=2730920 RepID=A0A849I096_9HYPH|nr:hypothetical protein [Enterovirga sp. DB1703]NNM72762.1 hypothetical protein [Enterovirga sp. DB1703]